MALTTVTCCHAFIHLLVRITWIFLCITEVSTEHNKKQKLFYYKSSAK